MQQHLKTDLVVKAVLHVMVVVVLSLANVQRSIANCVHHMHQRIRQHSRDGDAMAMAMAKVSHLLSLSVHKTLLNVAHMCVRT